eukprot:1864907-Alexandrium_andersonii.AAC.1
MFYQENNISQQAVRTMTTTLAHTSGLGRHLPPRLRQTERAGAAAAGGQPWRLGAKRRREEGP